MFTITLPCTLALLFIYAFLFTIWYFPHITVQLSIWQCLQHIRNIYIQYCLQLQYPVDWLCCLYMLPLHNVIFFHNYCTIDSTTIFPAYPQHIPTVLFTITLTSILTLLFIYASFTQCDIFSQLLHNWLCNNVYSIFATYTYGNVYNHTSLYTGFAVYICFPFHNMIFFHNYYTIDSATMSTAYSQHIHTILFTIKYPVDWLCCLYMLPLHNVIFFHNYCTIDSTTIFPAYPQHIPTVLFTITLTSILTVLFTFAFLFTMWYFFTITAQLTLQQCLQHILNIYIQYCYNYSTQ